MSLPTTTYPTISTVGKAQGWSEPYSDEAVFRANMSSGYPFSYQTRTFDPKTFTHVLRHVSTADMETLRTFYNSNKASEFWWLHPSVNENMYYHVQYKEKFVPQIDQDEDGDWMIVQTFEQMSTVTLESGDYGYGEYGDGLYLG